MTTQYKEISLDSIQLPSITICDYGLTGHKSDYKIDNCVLNGFEDCDFAYEYINIFDAFGDVTRCIRINGGI